MVLIQPLKLLSNDTSPDKTHPYSKLTDSFIYLEMHGLIIVSRVPELMFALCSLAHVFGSCSFAKRKTTVLLLYEILNDSNKRLYRPARAF